MKIFNIMLTRRLGGIEQAFLDYNKALNLKGHQVVNITSSFALINKKNINSIKLPNIVPWCIFSKIYLKLLILFYKPDLIIAHGGRAVNFACGTGIKNVPIIGVTHACSVRHILKCHYLIALGSLLKKHVMDNGYPESQIFIVPNMVNILPKKLTNSSLKKTTYVIGAIGRFAPEKGFNYLIEAISILLNRRYKVKLLLGGAGELDMQLKKLAIDINIEKEVEFIGWVKNKKSFFESIDIFCIPSVYEPFGIVALESMSHQVPIVSTKTIGASEIFEPNVDALITKTGSSQELADQIAYLIDNPAKREELQNNAYNKVVNQYDMQVVANKLSEALENILSLSVKY